MADYRSRVAGMLFDEGGLSNNPLDTTAARYPVPDGSGNHTNKGITWLAFASLGPKLGYQPTADLFYSMPKDVWMKIYKVGFWDVIKGDQIKSQAIADMLIDIAFHSGTGRAGQLAQRALNQLGHQPTFKENLAFSDSIIVGLNKFSNTKKQQLLLLQKIVEVRMAHLKSLSVWGSFKNGWTTRVEKLYKSGIQLIKKEPRAITGVVVFALAFGGYLFFNKTQS